LQNLSLALNIFDEFQESKFIAAFQHCPMADFKVLNFVRIRNN